MIEASFILRAYRSTLPRLGYRRQSAREIEVPADLVGVPGHTGGQNLGETRDYAQRLLEIRESVGPEERTSIRSLLSPNPPPKACRPLSTTCVIRGCWRAAGRAAKQEPFDITRQPLRFPMPRSGYLQALARGESGGMLALAYSSMRGWGGTGHGAMAELRAGELPVRIHHPVTGRVATMADPGDRSAIRQRRQGRIQERRRRIRDRLRAGARARRA